MEPKAIETCIIQIGNSQGIRIKKELLALSGVAETVGDAVELIVSDGTITIRKHSSKVPRSGWANAFQEMAASGEDTLLDGEIQNTWDEDEWEWESE